MSLWISICWIYWSCFSSLCTYLFTLVWWSIYSNIFLHGSKFDWLSHFCVQATKKDQRTNLILHIIILLWNLRKLVTYHVLAPNPDEILKEYQSQCDLLDHVCDWCKVYTVSMPSSSLSQCSFLPATGLWLRWMNIIKKHNPLFCLMAICFESHYLNEMVMKKQVFDTDPMHSFCWWTTKFCWNDDFQLVAVRINCVHRKFLSLDMGSYNGFNPVSLVISKLLNSFNHYCVNVFQDDVFFSVFSFFLWLFSNALWPVWLRMKFPPPPNCVHFGACKLRARRHCMQKKNWKIILCVMVFVLNEAQTTLCNLIIYYGVCSKWRIDVIIPNPAPMFFDNQF